MALKRKAMHAVEKGGFSVTWGDCAETHVGMQIHGEMAKDGFSVEELTRFAEKFGGELYELNDHLPLLLQSDSNPLVWVLPDGVDILFGKGAAETLERELRSPKMKYDKKAKMRGKVVNKRARWNNCFGPVAQSPDYEHGKGTVVAFESVPILAKMRKELSVHFEEKAKNLYAEANFYFDEKCGIGFHGDAERKRVICMRLGRSTPMHFQWFHRCLPVGTRCEIQLHHGDLYMMSEKATGFDWKKSSQYTLRHATGHPKYTTIKPKTSPHPEKTKI